MTAPKYEEAMPGMECNLSQTSLEDCAVRLGPSFIYEVRVSPSDGPRARRILHAISAAVLNHPFAPYINVIIEPSYRWCEWSISANGRMFGSKGVL